MTDKDYRTQEFRDLGFRCLEPTKARLQDGSEVTIKADSYRKPLERPNDTPRRRRALKLYTVVFDSGVREVIDELTLEERLGTETFNQLPT
jgi:hypothetical protein